MSVKDLFDLVNAKANKFGMVAKNGGKTIDNANGNTIVRNNTIDVSFTDGKAYFGFIGEEEETSGAYSDFSFVIFPEQELGACVVALGVGSLGFKNDYQLASLPGLRRDFLRLQSKDNMSFFKTNFSDIESTSSELLKEVKTNYPALGKVIESYKTVLPAARIVNFNELGEQKALEIIYKWLAMYARMREWGNAKQRQIVDQTLATLPDAPRPDEKADIKQLLESRKYVVLQGAPGTGKTWNALNIAKNYQKTIFEQFHTETTYSDFVYGIEPNMNAKNGESQFKPKEGVLYQAIKYASEHENEKVLLIIDEINRANLSNVLGPIFYLFEYQAGERNVSFKIGDMEIKKLPENLHVIATMNTADRSLAVVDFALRRRFAWYTLRPHELDKTECNTFDKDIFRKFADIFYKYATDEELNLQPGQSYFTDKERMEERMIYELMPLIKEYLAEGYLLRAKDAFCDLFLKETGKLMYE